MDFEILKTGSFTNSQGKEVNFSQSDLEKIASSYDPTISEAPIVIGHPKSNDPAYGWIDSLNVNGDKLIASASKIVPEFLNAVKEGLFKKRSVSLNPDNSLRHVGFLGAALPAVKGLADLQFEDSREENIIEFSSVATNEVEGSDEEFHLSDVLLQLTNLSEEVNKLTNEFYEWKELRINLDRSESNAEPSLGVVYTFSSNFKDQVEQAFSDGKLTVPMKEKLLSLLTMDFSDGAVEKFTLENFLSEFVSSFPVIISKENFATPPAKQEDTVPKPFDFSEFILDEDAAQVHKKIVEVVMDKKISYQDAAQIVFNS
ncbi:MAG: hypothetical protein M0P61_05835 [Ignavibacteriaceae bacterium]|nr:hypothetical protein [Ignavibacteriaceae bacterium]